MHFSNRSITDKTTYDVLGIRRQTLYCCPMLINLIATVVNPMKYVLVISVLKEYVCPHSMLKAI